MQEISERPGEVEAVPEGRRALRHFSLVLEYDGAPFHGWQRQPDGTSTVQGELERVCSTILDQQVRVRGAGRTDAGVHALGQWATFSACTRLAPGSLLRGLNAVLPAAIRVRHLDEADQPLDALRQACRKTYFYQYHVGSFLPPHRRSCFGLARGGLDFRAMRAAARLLEGEHDFSSFVTEAQRQWTCVRRLDRARVVAIPGGVRLYFTAPGFLYNMVRTLAAALKEVGCGHWRPETLGAVLAARDRSQGPETAPPQGLFLFRVDWSSSVTKALRRRPGRRSASGSFREEEFEP